MGRNLIRAQKHIVAKGRDKPNLCWIPLLPMLRFPPLHISTKTQSEAGRLLGYDDHVQTSYTTAIIESGIN